MAEMRSETCFLHEFAASALRGARAFFLTESDEILPQNIALESLPKNMNLSTFLEIFKI